MLRSLRNYLPSQAEAVLASLSTEVLIDPGVGQGEPHLIHLDSRKRQEVWAEIFRRLRIQEGDESQEARGKLYDFLADEITRLALSEADTDKIRANVGQKGNLRPDLYKEKISDEAKAKAVERSISLGEIRDVLQQPDEVEHLLPEHFGKTGDAISLYSQEWETVKTEQTSFLLVLTRRTGYVQTVLDVIRFYKSDVDVSAARKPLELLNAFVQTYGLVQRVGERTGKFFLYETLPFSGNPATFLEVPNSKSFRASAFVKFSKDLVEIAIAYSIDEQKYLSDLKDHEKHG